VASSEREKDRSEQRGRHDSSAMSKGLIPISDSEDEEDAKEQRDKSNDDDEESDATITTDDASRPSHPLPTKHMDQKMEEKRRRGKLPIMRQYVKLAKAKKRANEEKKALELAK